MDETDTLEGLGVPGKQRGCIQPGELLLEPRTENDSIVGTATSILRLGVFPPNLFGSSSLQDQPPAGQEGAHR